MGFDMSQFAVFRELLDSFVHKYSSERPDVFIRFYKSTIEAGVSVRDFDLSLYLRKNYDFFRREIADKNHALLSSLSYFSRNMDVSFEPRMLQLMVHFVAKNSLISVKRLCEELLARDESLVQGIFDFAEDYEKAYLFADHGRNLFMNLMVVEILVGHIVLEERLVLKLLVECSISLKKRDKPYLFKMHQVLEKINRSLQIRNEHIREAFLTFLNLFRLKCQAKQSYSVGR